MVVYAQNLKNATKLPSYALLCETFQMKRINVKRRMHPDHDKFQERSSTDSSVSAKDVMHKMSYNNNYVLSSIHQP